MKPCLLRNALVSLLCGVALIVTLGACSRGNDSVIHAPHHVEDGKTALTFFGYKADAMNLTAIEHAMQSYMAAHEDVDVTYDGIKGTTYWEAFEKRDRAGELDDVVMMHHDHVLDMSEQGKLADLSDIPGIENFTDEAREQFTNPDGTVYFLPTQISTYNLYVNEDLLSQHGLEPPANWEEFQQACDYFVSRGIVPLIANNRNSLPTLIQARGLYELYQQPEDEINATLFAFNENPALYAQALAPGVEQVANMIERGWIDTEEALATEQTSDDLELFMKGDRPFMLTGGWALSRVGAEGPGFDYGVYPYPVLEDGAVLPMQIDTCISVNANSPNVEQAKDFVAHLIEPEVMWEYCDGQDSCAPLSNGPMPRNEKLAPTVESLTDGRTVLRAEYRLNLPSEAALAAATNALLTRQGIEQAQAALLQELSK